MAFFKAIDFFLISVLSILALVYTVQAICFLVSQARCLNKNPAVHSPAEGSLLMPISLVSAIGDEEGLVEYVRSLLNLDYPSYEVIAVCSALSEAAINELCGAFNLVSVGFPVRMRLKCKKINAVYISADFPDLVVVDKAKGAIGDSFNCGLNISKHALYAQTEKKYQLYPSCLRRAASYMAYDLSIARIFSPCGIVLGEGANASHTEMKAAAEHLYELMISPVPGGNYRAHSYFSCGFALADKELAIQAGGFLRTSDYPGLAHHIALSKLIVESKTRSKSFMMAEPYCSLNAPTDINSVKKEAIARYKEVMSALISNRSVFFKAEYKSLGFISLPYYLFSELGAPLVDLALAVYIPLRFLIDPSGFFSSIVLYLLAGIAFRALLGACAASLLGSRFSSTDTVGSLIKLAACAASLAFSNRLSYAYNCFVSILLLYKYPSID
ncbi:MAG: hypothetical protein FWG30_06950 [Eubacteriaceae bacterium]|nr:hypothetical protein [Eubacteriaceae bacterium]